MTRTLVGSYCVETVVASEFDVDAEDLYTDVDFNARTISTYIPGRFLLRDFVDRGVRVGKILNMSEGWKFSACMR